MRTNRGWVAVGLGAVILASCSASETERATPKAESDTGRQLYVQYCASCHGAEGTGDGPVAASLATPPADLSTIARRNNGVFDELAVMSTIDGRRDIAAHGSREMPVWGAVFASEHAAAGQRQAAQLSVLLTTLLTDYLASLQRE